MPQRYALRQWRLYSTLRPIVNIPAPPRRLAWNDWRLLLSSLSHFIAGKADDKITSNILSGSRVRLSRRLRIGRGAGCAALRERSRALRGGGRGPGRRRVPQCPEA